MRKIKLLKINNIKYIYINRDINNFLFTQEELNKARERYEKHKERNYLKYLK